MRAVKAGAVAEHRGYHGDQVDHRTAWCYMRGIPAKPEDAHAGVKGRWVGVLPGVGPAVLLYLHSMNPGARPSLP
jgi:hypothetical protein